VHGDSSITANFRTNISAILPDNLEFFLVITKSLVFYFTSFRGTPSVFPGTVVGEKLIRTS
jgi:hypothetical protein